ncbi:hypothetical protein LXA43DRAFT_1138013 [Ganoderma leucocontextum]|nr:hypothetical protein LXA43DRAFT_1138013 [Ganoderma leucocontextum]
MYPHSGLAETAAALHAKLLERDESMSPPGPPFVRHLLDVGQINAALGLTETKPPKHFTDVTSVAPNRFAKPQPRPSLYRILNWQDQNERCSPQSDTNSARKGIIEKILLVAGRRRVENEESNEAPAWPPAPELIANPPNWGRKASHASTLSLGLNIALPIASTVSCGHFIGRDGTEWPLPPTECMPESSPSLIAHPRVLPALTLDGDKWTTPIRALDGLEVDGAPFIAAGNELQDKHCTLSCSTAATFLPRTPADDVVLLPLRKANGKAKAECSPRWGVIGEGRPKPVYPPTPLLGPTLRLPSPPFLASQAAYVASESESEDGPESVGGGYWSESESEYAESDSDDSDTWSGSDVDSAHGSDSDEEGDFEAEFFVADDGTAWPLPPAELVAAAGAAHRGRNPVPRR